MTVVAAVLMSLAVARMITPMVAAYFLKAKGHASHGEGWLMDRYIRVLRWTLHNRWKTLLLGGGGAFAATIMAFMTLHFPFQPTIDTDYTQVNVEMVPGSTLAQHGAVTQHVPDGLSPTTIVDYSFSEPTQNTAHSPTTLKKG